MEARILEYILKLFGMRNKKLSLERFKIARLQNLSRIIGGTGDDSNTNLTTDTVGSENTTYTTDPNVQCPYTTDDTTGGPSNHTNGHTGIPTFGNVCPGP